MVADRKGKRERVGDRYERNKERERKGERDE